MDIFDSTPHWDESSSTDDNRHLSHLLGLVVRHVLALLLCNASIGHDALYLLVRFEVCRVLVGNAGQFGHDLAGEEVAADVDKGSD